MNLPSGFKNFAYVDWMFEGRMEEMEILGHFLWRIKFE